MNTYGSVANSLEITRLAGEQHAALVAFDDDARQDRADLAPAQAREHGGDGRRAVEELEVAHGRIAERELSARVQVDRRARTEPAHLGDLALVGDGFLPLRHRGGEEARVEPERLDLRRDPVSEVHERVGRQGEALGSQHVPESPVIGLTRLAIARVPFAVRANRTAVRPITQPDPDRFERLANDAAPVAERGRRRGPSKPPRGVRRVDLPAPGGDVVRAIARFDLAPWEDEISGGKLARGVAADQEHLERAR